MTKNDPLKSYPCPLCCGTSAERLYTLKGFRIVSCNECGMVYVNPRIPNDRLYDIYTNSYFHSQSEGYEDYELTAHLRKKTFGRWLEKIVPLLKIRQDAALDIGCAAGYFLELLEQNGWDAEGVELDKEMLVVVRGKGFTVHDTPLERLALKRKYGLVTLFDVLEHLPDPHEGMERLYSLLADNGSVALVTPDFGSTQHRLFRSRWFQLKPREHILCFTLGTLTKLAEQHGFAVVHHSPSGQYADFPFLCGRLRRYGFGMAALPFRVLVSLLGLSNKVWYTGTGSMMVLLQKR